MHAHHRIPGHGRGRRGSAPAWRAGTALALSLLASGARPAAAARDATEDLRSRPAHHTPVSAAIFLNDVAQVEDARQQATVDLALRLTWRDPRLAGRFQEPALVSLDEIWTPRLSIVNDRSLGPRLPDRVLVLPDGTLRQVQRWVGDVAFPTNLAEFPFDRQSLEISVLFLTLPGEAEITLDRGVPLAAPRFSLPGWSTLPPAAEVARGSPFSPDHYRLTFTQPIQRNRGYYLWTLFLPLALVVIMGMMPFWIERNIEARVGLSATSVLTLIAFRFAMSQMVPPLPYLTRLDGFVLAATLLVFLSLAGVAAMSWLTASGNGRLADRLCRGARVFLPLALFVVGIVSLAPGWR